MAHPYDPATCNGCGTTTARLWLMADDRGDGFYCAPCVQADPALEQSDPDDLEIEIALVDLALALRAYRREQAARS